MSLKFPFDPDEFPSIFCLGCLVDLHWRISGRQTAFYRCTDRFHFSTLGIASLFMPALMGIIADKWLNAEKVLGICHLVGAGLLLWSSTITDPDLFFWVMLLNSMFYMPTIALNNTVSYIILEKMDLTSSRIFRRSVSGVRWVSLWPCGSWI